MRVLGIAATVFFVLFLAIGVIMLFGTDLRTLLGQAPHDAGAAVAGEENGPAPDAGMKNFGGPTDWDGGAR